MGADTPSTIRQEAATTEVSSVVRTLTLKLTQERARHRQEVGDLQAALAAAYVALLALKRRHGQLDWRVRRLGTPDRPDVGSNGFQPGALGRVGDHPGVDSSRYGARQ
jgi:hypothetical protein